MIDALLFAVRDAIRGTSYGYSEATCDIRDDGKPPAGCGDWFVAVHQGNVDGFGKGRLDEYYSFSLTLTARLRGIPLDRIGTKLLASELARRQGPQGQPSFNARAEQLRAFLHEDWGVLQDANINLVRMEPDADLVYGFCEPMRYQGMETPAFVYADWFGANPESDEMGLKAELRFGECRRFQAIATFV